MMKNEDFQIFYEKYFGFSNEVIYQVVKDRSLAEEISQELFYHFYESDLELDFSSEKKLRAFVTKASVNKALDYYKKACVKNETAVLEQLPHHAFDMGNVVESAVLQMEENEYRKLVLHKLRSKNRISYEILIKVKYLDIPPDLVAKEYGITRNNLNNRIFRARIWLETEMSRLY